jgi:cation diffusion facilitator family transporter
LSSLAARVLPPDPASRAAALSIYMNAVLMMLKVGVGLAVGSVAVLSDGIDSGQDLVAALIAFASVRIGARPADARHPFGHGRAETVAAGIQALLIGAGGVFIVVRAVMRLLDPPEEIGYDIALVAMLIAAVANATLVQYTGRVARETGSPALLSETRHLWTNVVQAGAVIAGLAMVGITGEVAFDALLALGLGGYLLWVAGNIFWTSVGDVLDTSLTQEELARIEAAILEEGSIVPGFHRLRARRSGQARQIDFHLILPGSLNLTQGHEIADRVESRIEALWPGTIVTIHTEPADGRFRGPLEEPSSHGREGEEPSEASDA